MFRFLEKLSKRSIALIEVQLLVFAAIVFALLYGFIDFLVYLALHALIVAAYLYVLFRQLLKEVEEKNSYLIFFVILIALVEAAAFIPWLSAKFGYGSYMACGLLVAMVAYAVGFRLLLGRNYTYGVVEICGENECTVKTEVDILAFTNAGKFIVKSARKYPKGQKAKIRVKQGLFSRRPYEIRD